MNIRKKIFLLAMMVLAVGLLAAPAISLAVPPPEGTSLQTTLIVPIDGVKSVGSPGDYIATLFKWGIGLAALLAMGQLVLGGVLYTLSAGSIANQEGAKERIKSSITGLILLIGSVTLLYTINPNLVNLKPIDATQDNQAAINRARATGEQIEADQAALAAKAQSQVAAVQGAQARINGNPDNANDCAVAHFKIKDLIDNVNTRNRTAAQAATTGGDYTIADKVPFGTIADASIGFNFGGAFNKGTDFKTVLQDVQDALAAGNNYEYGCYQDSIIIAYEYAKNNLSDQAFSDFLRAFKSLPQNLEAQKYLDADPFSRSSVTAAGIRTELLNSLSSGDQEIYNNIKNLVDTKPFKLNVLAQFLVDNASVPAALGGYYAKEKLSPADYTALFNKVRSNNGGVTPSAYTHSS